MSYIILYITFRFTKCYWSDVGAMMYVGVISTVVYFKAYLSLVNHMYSVLPPDWVGAQVVAQVHVGVGSSAIANGVTHPWGSQLYR